MPYTYKAVALVWLTVSGLVALSASGTVAGSSVLLLVSAALVLPALILGFFAKPQGLDGIAASNELPAAASTDRRHPVRKSIAVAAYRENEGGARGAA